MAVVGAGKNDYDEWTEEWGEEVNDDTSGLSFWVGLSINEVR